jgi:hypothetical protein
LNIPDYRFCIQAHQIGCRRYFQNRAANQASLKTVASRRFEFVFNSREAANRSGWAMRGVLATLAG